MAPHSADVVPGQVSTRHLTWEEREVCLKEDLPLPLGTRVACVPSGCGQPLLLEEKTLESPLDCKEIQPFNPKGNQP